MVKKALESGTLYIRSDVLAMITAICVQEVEGVKVMSGFKDGVSGLLNKNYHKNGITVIEEEEQIGIEVRVALEYGMKIKNTCELLQATILKEIKCMTGIRLSNLKIKVDGLIASAT
ncbi:Asp23/Gls24 family envelope stress response protein [Fredinandcohnia humi]